MCDKSLRYSTEITNELCYKYAAPQRPPGLAMRTMFSPNDMNMALKTYDGIKMGLFCGTGFGLLNCTAGLPYQFKPQDMTRFQYTAPHFFKAFVPWAVAGPVYGLATSFSANVRHKEDWLNHFIGGLAAGSVFGFWYKNRMLISSGAVIAALICGGIKWTVDNQESKPFRPIPIYQGTWFTEKIPVEGTEDDEYKYYKP